MIKIIDKNDEIVQYLQSSGYPQLNALNALETYPDWIVYIYDNDITEGVIISNPDQNFFYLATTKRQFLDEFWASLNAGEKEFSGVPANIVEIFLRDKSAFWESHCKCYAYCTSISDNFMPVISDIYTVEPLAITDAEVVDEFYTFRGDWSLEAHRESISKRDSSCVRIDDELACWCLVHDDGSMGPIYTKEKFRRRGLAELVYSDLAGKLIKKGKAPYFQVNTDNNTSLTLAAKNPAIKYTHDCLWFGVIKE